MPFILLAIIAVAAIVVAGMSAVHGPAVMATGPATILPADSNFGMALFGLVLAIAVISLWVWWIFRRRR